MALFLPGQGVAVISGSIGGTTFSRNRFGAYMRNRSKPVNPNSERQQAVRNIMGAIVAEWLNELTVAQRAAWEVYAAAINFINALGQTITLTGYNHYIRTNMSRVTNGLTRVSTAPVNLTLPPSDALFDCEYSQATQQVTVTFDDNAAWCTQNSAYMSIHQGIPQNSARSFFGGHFRRIGKIDGDSASPITSPQSLDVSFPVAVTQKDWTFGRVCEEDGRLSFDFRDVAVVGA